jgi:hypothetical protein
MVSLVLPAAACWAVGRLAWRATRRFRPKEGGPLEVEVGEELRGGDGCSSREQQQGQSLEASEAEVGEGGKEEVVCL